MILKIVQNTNYNMSFSKDPVRPLIWLVIFLLATHFVIVKGVKDGIEKSSAYLIRGDHYALQTEQST